MNVLAWPAYKRRRLNPYTYLLYSHLEEIGIDVTEFRLREAMLTRYGVWHIHWPESVWKDATRRRALANAFACSLLLLSTRPRGVKVIWTVHNIRPHEKGNRLLDAWFRWWYLRFVDGIISLSSSGEQLVREAYPQLTKVPSVVIPHGHYIDSYPNTISAAEARHTLGVDRDDEVILSIGQVRPYKNIPDLIRAFKTMAKPTSRLVIAGKPNTPELRDEIVATAGRDLRILLHLRFIEDEELQVFFGAADLVVLPYREILNSGSAILALSFLCPVLVPNRGAMAELQDRLGSPAVTTFDGPITAGIVRETLERLRVEALNTEALQANVRRILDWERIAKDTMRFYESV